MAGHGSPAPEDKAQHPNRKVAPSHWQMPSATEMAGDAAYARLREALWTDEDEANWEPEISSAEDIGPHAVRYRGPGRVG